MATGNQSGIDTELLKQQMSTLMKTIGEDMRRLSDRAKEWSGPSGGLGRMDAVFSSMRTTILGSAGLAYGLYQVGRSMEEFASHSIKAENFARNMGLSVKSVQELNQAFQRTGMSSGEADNKLGSMMSKIMELRTFREGSGAYQELKKSPGGAELAVAMMNAKSEREALQVLFDAIKRQTEGGKRVLASIFSGGDVAILERANQELAKTIPIIEANEKAAQKFHDTWINVSTSYGNIWTKMKNDTMEGTNAVADWLAKMGADSEAFAKTTEKAMGGAARFLGLDRIKTGAEYAGKGALWLHDNYNPSWDNFRKATGWNVLDPKNPRDPMGADNAAGQFEPISEENRAAVRKGMRATDFGGMRRTDSIGQETNTILSEIRDTLQGKGTPLGGGTYGVGIRTEDGAAQAGLGGFRPFRGGGTGGDIGRMLRGETGRGTPGVGAARAKIGKGDDPRGLEGFIRETAIKYGIDPDTAVAVAKSEGLRNPVGDGGKSHGAFQLFTGGGVGNLWQKANPGLDIADPANEKSTIDFALKRASQRGWGEWHGAKRTGIGPRDGIGNGPNSPGRPSYMDGSGDGLPSAVIDEARRVAAREGTGESVQSYIRSQGYNVNSAWCGDFAAAVVRGAGGTPPPGHSVASNWRKYGQQVETPQPGDIAVRRGVRTGQTGSHVTIVDNVDGNRFTGLGGNQSQRRSRFPVGRFDFFRGDQESTAARDRIDAERKAEKEGAFGRLNGKIEFLNVPSGVKTSMEQEGNVFRELSISKTKQAGTMDDQLGRYPY